MNSPIGRASCASASSSDSEKACFDRWDVRQSTHWLRDTPRNRSTYSGKMVAVEQENFAGVVVVDLVEMLLVQLQRVRP